MLELPFGKVKMVKVKNKNSYGKNQIACYLMDGPNWVYYLNNIKKEEEYSEICEEFKYVRYKKNCSL